MKDSEYFNVVRWLGECPECKVENSIMWQPEDIKNPDFKMPHCLACSSEFKNLDSRNPVEASDLFPTEIRKIIIEGEYRAFFLINPQESLITHANLLVSVLTCSLAEKFPFPEGQTLLESSYEGGVHVVYSGKPVDLRHQRSYSNGGIGFGVQYPRPSKGEAVYAVMGYLEKLLTSLVIYPIEYYKRKYKSGAFLRLTEDSYKEDAVQILKDGLTSLESKEFTNNVFKRLVLTASNQSNWRALGGV